MTLGYHHRACKTLFRSIDLEGDCNISDIQTLERSVSTFMRQPNEQVRTLGLLTLANVLRLAGNYRAAENY
ncbi:MAG: hypothetical protein HC810_00275 [Acaryochloridaceae cyanobacterium RL_2_7]|nr:hypothetical protein [Acaryochloridaceae cyanobacterium RL_2_7]